MSLEYNISEQILQFPRVNLECVSLASNARIEMESFLHAMNLKSYNFNLYNEFNWIANLTCKLDLQEGILLMYFLPLAVSKRRPRIASKGLHITR